MAQVTDLESANGRSEWGFIKHQRRREGYKSALENLSACDTLHAVRTMSNMSGLRYAVISILLLVVVVVTIAPEVDLEDGVLRFEFAVYALLLAAISIIALPMVTADSPRFVHAFLSPAGPSSGSSQPSATQILRC